MKSRVTPKAKIVGKNLKNLRQIKNISQVELAKILGVTFQQVQKYERGLNRLPVDKLHLAKEEFGIPYDYFFEGMGGVGMGSLENISKEISKEASKLLNRNALLEILSLVYTLKNYETALYETRAESTKH